MPPCSNEVIGFATLMLLLELTELLVLKNYRSTWLFYTVSAQLLSGLTKY